MDTGAAMPRAGPSGAGGAGPIRPIAFGLFADWPNVIRHHLDARYAPSFVDLADARLDDFDAIVPLATGHYEALARRPDLRGRKFFHPAPDVVELCSDKLRLTEFLIAAGFGRFVPPLRAPGPPYPYVWKRRRGGWGVHCRAIDGPQAERSLDLGDPDWFAQALAPGPLEFATHILRVRGEVRYVSTFAYEMAGPALILGQRHAPRRIRFARGCGHLDLFGAILARLDYEGTACFDYKVADGWPLLFEINPRYGASLGMDITAYADAYVAALRSD